MFYDFPRINHISDVLPHIKDREEFRVIEKDDYTVINYAVAFDNTFEWDINDPVGFAIRRECRGLIFDTKTGQLISRPYHKFFNVGERDETSINKINLYEPHVVLEKLDGSMIRPIPTKEGFRLATKAGITDVAMNAEAFTIGNSNYNKFIKYCIDKDSTPIFEWISRKNRIVIDYPEDNLIITAVRSNKTGFYLPYSILQTLAYDFKLPLVKALDGLAVQNINLFVKQVREWDDGEGVVIRFNSCHMVKVKADDYVLRHKTKDQINQEKNVITVILNDSVDDLIPLLTTEDATRLQEFQRAFWLGVEDVASEIYDLYLQIDKGQDQKEFAMSAVASVLPQYQNFMYRLRKGDKVKDLVVEQIRKSLGSQSKIDSSRWLFGNIVW